jgi:hypothetical protein
MTTYQASLYPELPTNHVVLLPAAQSHNKNIGGSRGIVPLTVCIPHRAFMPLVDIVMQLIDDLLLELECTDLF